MNPTNRRQFDRYESELQVDLYKLGGAVKARLDAELVNIGVGGMACKVVEEVALDDEVLVEIHLPGNQGVLCVEGWIRHVTRIPSGRRRVGIQFVVVRGMVTEEFAIRLEEALDREDGTQAVDGPGDEPGR